MRNSRFSKLNNLLSKNKIIDSHTHVGIDNRIYLNYGYPYCQSLEDLIIRMKYLKINYSVVFPFANSAYYIYNPNKPEKIITTDKYCDFPYKIENKNLLKEVYDIFPEYTDYVFPFCMFDPSRNVEKQADYLEELNEKYPLYGLKSIPTYIQSFVKDIETRGKPILNFLKKYNLPLTLHSACAPQDIWSNVYDIIDFCERNQEVTVCIAHTARFVEPVLKRAHKLANCYVDVSALKIHCDGALKNSIFVAKQKERLDTDYKNPANVLKQLIDRYPDTIIWGTDTPYYYYKQDYYSAGGVLIKENLSCSFEEEVKILRKLPGHYIKQVADKNCLNFLMARCKTAKIC